MKYILIRSAEDLDPRKISIKEINRKYVDPMGNRYATRFNMDTRRVEVVRLASSREEAIALRREILKEKRQRRIEGRQKSSSSYEIIFDDQEEQPAAAASASPQVESSPYETLSELEIVDDFMPAKPVPRDYTAVPAHIMAKNKPAASEQVEYYDPYEDDFRFQQPIGKAEGETKSDFPEGDGTPFHEARFLEEANVELLKVKDRLLAMVNNFKKSKLFEAYKTDMVFDIIRSLDGDCRSTVENAINLYKEIMHYPRPISYYISRLNDLRKDMIDSEPDEEKRKEIIRRWELQDTFETTYNHLLKVNTNLLRTLAEIPPEVIKSLPAMQGSYVDNARTSCQLMIEDANRMLTRISIWRKQTK